MTRTTDKMFTVLIYTMFSLFALVCVYPFYSIIINTISANDISARGEIVFYPKQIHFQTFIDLFTIPGLGDAALISL